MKKLSFRWDYLEAQALDTILSHLLKSRDDAGAEERCIVSVLLIWQAKKLRASLPFPDYEKGHKLTIDAPVAYALCALIDFNTLDPKTLIGTRMLQLFASIEQTFFSPIY